MQCKNTIENCEENWRQECTKKDQAVQNVRKQDFLQHVVPDHVQTSEHTIFLLQKQTI